VTKVATTIALGCAGAALYSRLRTLWPLIVGHAVIDIAAFSS
jgi:hypothetical protein